MKQLKSTISKTKYLALSILMAFSFSCSPEDGEDGLQGEPGVAGIAGADGNDGTDGADGNDGTDGADGSDGTDGEDGSDGTDGNANVQTYTFDTSTENGQFWNIEATQLTQDVLDNDVIIGYLQRNGSYYPVPGTSFADEIKLSYFITTAQFLFYDRESGADLTPTVGNYNLFKMIIIESSSTTAGKTNTKQSIYNELEEANVNIDDYYAVCDFYGIAY